MFVELPLEIHSGIFVIRIVVGHAQLTLIHDRVLKERANVGPVLFLHIVHVEQVVEVVVGRFLQQSDLVNVIFYGQLVNRLVLQVIDKCDEVLLVCLSSKKLMHLPLHVLLAVVTFFFPKLLLLLLNGGLRLTLAIVLLRRVVASKVHEEIVVVRVENLDGAQVGINGVKLLTNLSIQLLHLLSLLVVDVDFLLSHLCFLLVRELLKAVLLETLQVRLVSLVSNVFSGLNSRKIVALRMIEGEHGLVVVEDAVVAILVEPILRLW